MLALSLIEDIGIVAGLIVLVILLLTILVPLRVHVTVRHERDDSGDSKED